MSKLLSAGKMKINYTIPMILATSLAGLIPHVAVAADAVWPRFLGPEARALSANANLPDHWSDTECVEWKTSIPGRGWSSPIAWGDRVFLTTVVGPAEAELPMKGLYYGGERPNAPTSEYQWKVLCLDLRTGKVLWERLVHQAAPPGPVHIKNSYASETPVTDGERAYAYFGNVGVFCLDMEGRPVWSKSLPAYPMRHGWGTADSPVLHGDRLYVLDDNDKQSCLLALDKHTGKEVWRVDRDEKSNWSTPYVWDNGQRTEIVTAGTDKVRAYGLDGKLVWWFKGMSSITIASPYADRGLLYVSSGFILDKQRPLYAIRPNASGDISLLPKQTSNAAIAWSNPTAAPYNPTTLVYEGRLYVLYDLGKLGAFDSRSGKPLFEPQRLPGGKHFTASPWAHNGRVFCLDEDGVTFVVRAGDKFELLGTNKLAEDDMCLATPAMAGDRLLIRSAARVYCVRKPASNRGR